MDFTIDQEKLNEVMTTTVGKAVTDAFGSWSTKEALTKVVADQLAQMPIAKMVEEGLAKVDWEMLTTALAKEIERTVVAATVRTMRDSTVTLVMNMRGIPSYDQEKKRAQVYAELFDKRAQKEESKS